MTSDAPGCDTSGVPTLRRSALIIAAFAASATVAVAGCSPTGGADPASAQGAPSGAAAASVPATPSISSSPSASGSASPTPDTSGSPAATATVDKNAKVIYLTFDDGPWIPYTSQILKVLDKYDAQATFFVVGEMAAQHKDLIRDIADQGHAIGNHTWDHANLTTLSDEAILEEMGRTAKTLGTVGPVMGACMRPPYGATDGHIRKLLKNAGYHTYLWDFWAEDWNQPPVDTLINYLEVATEKGSNILLHDGGGDRPNTVEAVKIMIPRWIKQGYSFAALPACLVPFEGSA